MSDPRTERTGAAALGSAGDSHFSGADATGAVAALGSACGDPRLSSVDASDAEAALAPGSGDAQLSVNGAAAAIPSPATVGGLIAAMTAPDSHPGRGIAVALNGEVVPRSAWDSTGLQPGDRVEVLTAAQGG